MNVIKNGLCRENDQSKFLSKKKRRNILAFNFKNENRKGVIEGWTWPSYFNFGQDYNEFSICYMAYISQKKEKKNQFKTS